MEFRFGGGGVWEAERWHNKTEHLGENVYKINNRSTEIISMKINLQDWTNVKRELGTFTEINALVRSGKIGRPFKPLHRLIHT